MSTPDQPPSKTFSVTLRVIAGPHQGKTFRFRKHDTFLVGRSKHAHFRLVGSDNYFSRIHFLVEVNPPRCRIMDMRSRNGTYVNGRKVVTAELSDGDEIRAGHTLLRVSIKRSAAISRMLRAGAVASAATPASSPRAPSETITFKPEAAAPAAAPRVERQSGARLCVSCGAAPATGEVPLCRSCDQRSAALPQTVDGYCLLEQIGRGGMGVVYRAWRRQNGTIVAIKTLRPAVVVGPSEIRRFLREADILRQLEHPHIVAYRDMGQCQGQLYFAMEYVPGSDAKRLLQREGPWPIGRAVGLICQLLEALEFAHAKGFVHRDIKPANLLIVKSGGGEQLKLADFGLARVYQDSHLSGFTLAGEIGGTCGFMAPEQVLNFREARPAADQYGAAAALYNLLTGAFVYDLPAKDFQKALLTILHDPPVPVRARRREVPAGLAAVIARALEKEPGKRHRDVAALRRALAEWAQS